MSERIASIGRWQEDVLESPWRWLLTPGWLAYRPLIALRNALFDWRIRPIHRLPVPVISVGNITAGGTGKTPVVRAVVQGCERLGKRPYVLSRGYGGDGKTNDEAPLVGAPVICAADRVAGGMTAIAQGADCLIMDDGFQHRRLARDLDIVVIDATRPWGARSGRGAVLPLGFLREGRSGLARCDLIIISRSDQVPADECDRLAEDLAPFGKPVLRACHKPSGLQGLSKRMSLPASELCNRSVVLVSGIGNPIGFERTATELGWQVQASVRFPDHHRYRAEDLERIKEVCDLDTTAIVTTAKDAAKLASFMWDGPPISILQVDIAFSGGDGERFDQAIASCLRRG